MSDIGKFDVEVEMKRIKEVRAYVVKGGGADYHDQTPISIYPEHRTTWRNSF